MNRVVNYLLVTVTEGLQYCIGAVKCDHLACDVHHVTLVWNGFLGELL